MENGSNLQLKVELQADVIFQNKPLPIKITLVNKGNKSVQVNSRMALGYKNSLSREVYAIILNEKDYDPANFHPLDINRDFSTEKDFRLLSPNESISETYDLFEYYQFIQPGKYWITFYYDAAEPPANAPISVPRDILKSDAILIEIFPGTLHQN